MSGHAQFSPSAAHRWVRCPGSIQLESQIETDSGSKYAAEGTTAHFLAEQSLNSGDAPEEFIGLTIVQHAEGIDWAVDLDGPVEELYEHTVDDEMASFVGIYVDAVKRAAAGAILMVEQKLDFSDFIGVPEQYGTGDAIIIRQNMVEVHDLKYGKGVRVDAEGNEQLMLYGLGALAGFDMLGEFERVKMVIHQPRLDHISEWTISVEDLLAEADRFRKAAELAQDENPPFEASEKACRWCKAKAICPTAGDEVQDAMGIEEFDDLTESTMELSAMALDAEDLVKAYKALPYIEEWCKAVRERAHEMAEEGQLPGYKLVHGRSGNRAWIDPAAVERELREKMRLKKELVYTMKLKSPAQLERELKKKHPRKWNRLAEHIMQPVGKPTLVPEDDPRPAVSTNVAEDFDDLIN